MSDTIFKKVDYDLGGLVKDIDLGKIGLPDIQRPFVWPNTKVRDLFDSMYKGYPVGYLLFWENGQTLGNRSIGSDAKQLNPDLVIVDGQQRLTSLFAVIKAATVVRSNYKSERIHIAFNPLEEVFEVTSAAIQRDRSFIPDISRIWSHDTGLFQVVRDYQNSLGSVRPLSNDESRSIENAIQKLYGLTSFPLTALQLNADISEENVADVFVRINSQGKALNQADFILTLMSVFWDDGRTDLERFCRESKTPSAGVSSPYNHFIEPSPAQLLRVGVGLAFKRARLEHVYSILRGKDLETREFSEAQRIEQFEHLKKAQAKALNVQHWHDFMQCLRLAGYRSSRMINSETALMYSYTLYLIGRTEYGIEHNRLRPLIAQWFFMSAITGRYTGNSESRMESDLALLRAVKTGEEFGHRLRSVCAISLTDDYWEVTLPNELATSSSRSPSLFAYEAALILLEAPTMYSGFKVAEMIDPVLQSSRKAVERHHLFPRGYLTTHGITATRDVNQIANYAYIEWPDNVAISNQPPAVYLPPLEERFSRNELDQMYRYHALPSGWEKMDYWLFLERRRELMAQIIREAYNKLTTGPVMEPQLNEVDLAQIIANGESDAVEFKSTLRVNLHTRQVDGRIEHAALKTLAGFLNAEGGTLFVGIADDGAAVGLDADNFPSEDRINLHLTSIVNRNMGPVAGTQIHANFEDVQEHRVFVIRCERARTPVYLKVGDKESFYVRTGASTTELTISQAQEYIRQHWK